MLAKLVFILPLLQVAQSTEQCPLLPQWTIGNNEVLQDGYITVVGIVNSS
jgi:hypothetical protein